MFHERGAYYPARHTARQSRNQKAGKHIRAGITPEDNVFARRATNLTISSTETVWCRMLAPAEELVNIWQHVIAHSAAYEPRSGLPYVCTKQMVIPNDVVGECRQ